MMMPLDSLDDLEEFMVEVDLEGNAPPELEPAVDLRELEPQVAAFFAPDGPLRYSAEYGGRPYEYRSQQSRMARAIAAALTAGRNLAIEAPTGVGKSFAYLVPLIFLAQKLPHPLVVTTETINLQEQLITRDLPLLARLTGIPFKAALAKGRSNYLCRRRLALATGGERQAAFPGLVSQALELERVARWSEESADGDRDSAALRFEPSAWSHVCCEAGNCVGNRCEFFRRCFYWRARLDWESADIIVANHALFFADLKMQLEAPGELSALLPRYAAVVVDEAHTLEDSAADHLGLRVSQLGFLAYLNRMFNPDTGWGVLVRAGGDTLALRREVTEVKGAAQSFFALFDQFLAEVNDSIRRVSEAARFPDLLGARLCRLRELLASCAEAQEDKNFKTELEAYLSRCDAFIDAISRFIAMGVPDAVYWVERERDNIVLQAAPLNVAEILRTALFRRNFPVILTSATLTVDQKFDYYADRVGYEGAEPVRLDSPFEPEQVKLYLSRSIPDPKEDAYLPGLIREIPRYIGLTHGKAFVLFTSYSTMRSCADALRPWFEAEGIPLLLQGEGLSRTALLSTFKNDVDSVLFGTDSFWTGVDVPGEALSNVIVTKLPFAVPSHPLIKARCECIELSGKSSFMEYTLPEAVLKFRQGVGRLIRSTTDTGIIVILDRRLVSKRYGTLFLNSIPPYPQLPDSFA